MTISSQTRSLIDAFFSAIEPCHGTNLNVTFSYLAVRKGEAYYLIQGVVFYNTSPSQVPRTHFRSSHIMAGNYSLSEMSITTHELVEQLLSGRLTLPDGDNVLFPANEGGSFGANYDPFHQEGSKAQARYATLLVIGDAQQSYIDRPFLDWELRAAPTPYDGIHELMAQYALGTPRGITSVELIAFHVVAFDYGSQISGSHADLGVFLMHGLDTNKVTLGYRLFSQGKVESRSILLGNEMDWTETPKHKYGSKRIQVPNAAVIQCFASYAGVGQHFGWVFDPKAAQNSRRAVYSRFDDGQAVLRDFLSRSGARGRDARDFETAIAWLLWMLGFSVAHLGGTGRTQDAADLLATTPNGNFAVIECTTGLLKAENKLALLVHRTELTRQALISSNNAHLKILPIIVTALLRAEVGAELEQAERLGILVLSRENLEQATDFRTLLRPNPEQLYEEAIQTIEAAKSKYAPE